MDRVLVVSNIRAGRKQAIRYKKRIQKFLLERNIRFKFMNVEEVESTDIDGYDTILVVGGDGTINRILPYIKDKTIGIIPSGTANLLAAKIGIVNITDGLRAIDRERIKEVDLMYINETPFILRSGIGYDADIICKTPQSIKNRFGYFSYFISGIIFAMRLKRRRYRIELIGEREIEDGVEYNRYREIEKDASCVIIANAGNMYRNWISIGKKDRIEDGFMDIFILKTENPILFLLEIIKIVLGIKETSRIAEYIRVEKCIIRNEYCIAHIDGEKKILRKNITYRIEQKAIKIFC